MFNLPSIRATNYIAASMCLLLLLSAAFLQVELKLKPCPLCVIQRIIFLVIGILFLLGAFIKFKKISHKIYYGSIFTISLLGAAVAGRHIWLESLPAGQAESCGPALSYIFEVLPPKQAVQFLFASTEHCGAVTWKFLNFSIPHWTLLFFSSFILIAAWQFFRKAH